jgi:hypothetical protein
MRQQRNNEKKAAGDTTLQQPKMLGAATLTTRGNDTVEGSEKQTKIYAAVKEVLENSPVPYESRAVLPDRDREFLEKTFRGKIYQLGRLKQFLYLFNDEWIKVTPGYVRKVLRQRGRSKLLVKYYLSDWETICLLFGQIIWLNDIKMLQGKEVVA